MGEPSPQTLAAPPRTHLFKLILRRLRGESELARFNKQPTHAVPSYQARVLVSLRPSVLDPAGEASRAAATRLGVEGITSLRIGKAILVEIEAPDAAAAEARLSLLSERLLANPVIENWSLEWLEPSIATVSP